MLDQPGYVHVVINHFPLIGLLIAMMALIAALVMRHRPTILLGLALVGLLALSAWPVAEYGEDAYDRVLSMTDETGGKYLQRHRDAAEYWIFLYYVTAGVAGLALTLPWKWPRTLPLLSIVALVLAACSLVAGIYIAKSGGRIRHTEFRTSPP